MPKLLNLAEFCKEKVAWRTLLHTELSARGFKLTGERKKFNPDVPEGFSMLYPSKDPKEGLKVLGKVISFLERKGMTQGVEDEFDLNLQYVTEHFYVAVSLLRSGVCVYFEERDVELDFGFQKSPPADNLVERFKPERVRARAG